MPFFKFHSPLHLSLSHFVLNFQEKFRVSDYMKTQADLTPNMRAILVDWLVEVQENFELNHETLYLAVKTVDIYLGLKAVSREKLQLIGASALFIACKFDVCTFTRYFYQDMMDLSPMPIYKNQNSGIDSKYGSI